MKRVFKSRGGGEKISNIYTAHTRIIAFGRKREEVYFINDTNGIIFNYFICTKY